MKLSHQHEFTVEGSGVFPYDMLRYDRCWPAHESPDSVQIGRTSRPRQVTLRGLQPATVGRWESFGWKVVQG